LFWFTNGSESLGIEKKKKKKGYNCDLTGFENKKKEEWGGDRKGEFLKGLKEGRETLWRPRTFAVFHLPAFLFFCF